MESFEQLFGRPAAVRADAPGRVNLIGEHTDYNEGLVLPIAIPHRTRVEVADRHDSRVRAATSERPADGVLTYVVGAEQAGAGWLDHVQGLTHALRADGHHVGGFDVRIRSDVPVGSGLASSAALEVAVLRALRSLFHLALDDLALARIAHRAEHDFVGARVGIMDHMAASLAGEDGALFVDTRSLERRVVPLPNGTELVVLDSGISHRHTGGDYNTRRKECERAAALLGMRSLRELPPEQLSRAAVLPAPLDRRVRHVVTENARVLEAVQAMEAGDVARLGALFDASHASQRDDYAVSVAEVDLLVGLVRRDPAVHGARLTGGGFGGAVLALARTGTGRDVGERVVAAYTERSGQRGRLLVPS